MKILQIHNSYKYFGGEDFVVEEEAKLLKLHNHKVYQLIRHNKIELKSFFSKILLIKDLSYSRKSIKILKNFILKNGKPDVVHIHNIFPLWTYSILSYLSILNIPIIYTLHNYRLILENLATFDKKNHYYGTFKNSLILSKIFFMIANKNKFFFNKVDKFITHTQFTRNVFLKYGFKKNKIIIKPNFIKISKNKIIKTNKKKNAIYASRISKEKGILTLLRSWKNVDLKLDVLGDGPLMSENLKKNSNIIFYGNLKRSKVKKMINKSKFIVVPSEWYESFPMTILEAFNEGTLVLASSIGSIKSIIKHKVNGILFKAGDDLDLKKKISWILKNQNLCDKIVHQAKMDFIKNYTPNKNYQQLVNIYSEAILKKKNKNY